MINLKDISIITNKEQIEKMSKDQVMVKIFPDYINWKMFYIFVKNNFDYKIQLLKKKNEYLDVILYNVENKTAIKFYTYGKDVRMTTQSNVIDMHYINVLYNIIMNFLETKFSNYFKLVSLDINSFLNVKTFAKENNLHYTKPYKYFKINYKKLKKELKVIGKQHIID